MSAQNWLRDISDYGPACKNFLQADSVFQVTALNVRTVVLLVAMTKAREVVEALYSSKMDLFGSLSTGDTYGDSGSFESHTATLSQLMSTSSSDLSTASTEGTNEVTVLQSPQCPIGELSFYHGLGSRNAFRARLVKAGDFLVFCDVEHDCRPSLLVLNYNCCFVGVFVFDEDEEGKFFIQQAKQPHASFSSVGEAVQNYKLWGTILQVDALGSKNFYILVREVVNPIYEQMHSFGAKGIHWTHLPFYHGHLPRDQLSGRLERNGDFLLLAANDQHLLRLGVRWDDTIRILKIKLQPNSGHYCLPRTNKLQPVEIVSSVEEYVKAVVAGRCVLDNCVLKWPVNCPVVRRGQYRCCECCREAMDCYHGVPKISLRPLCSLPYYHGEKRDPYELKDRFVSIGDYGVYFCTSTKCLMLLVCYQSKTHGSTYVVCFKIVRADDNMLHLERHSRKHSFSTVSELVDFYANNRIKLATRFFGSPVRLLKPVISDEFLGNQRVVRNCRHDVLPYFFPTQQPYSCAYMFERDGDFMLSQHSEDSIPSLSVLVKGEVKVVELSSVERNGHYQLPRVHTAEPLEWVDSVDEFVKSSIVHGMPIFGLLPRRPILRDSKLRRVRHCTIKRKKNKEKQENV
ncbi:hypothetical protein TTRE_0000090101 [Trichuris trichiura]|uniref:SH2 domain-containing protein n=1 Tax=Trichuris trichiura TaxID=36087 RepID=A0A077YY48_TRITR|nr:hypothetical protein TTRE_0000090101 [Trichuris trichiura]